MIICENHYRVNPDCNSGCWIWSGGFNQFGYGKVWSPYKKKIVYAHRLSFEEHIRPLNFKECVCHRCDTPACVNPAHLFVGSYSENMQDAFKKGKLGWGENSARGVLSNAAAKEIRRKKNLGTTLKELSNEYKISQSAISAIARNKTYAEEKL